MPATPEPSPHVRINAGLLAIAEKRALVAMARQMPAWINSDYLTAVGFAGMIGAGAAFWASAAWRPALLLAILALAVNWFGDSLDGTLARVRHDERPRYGYYVDHVLDIAGITALMGGMAMSGVMSAGVALVMLVAYLLVSAEVFLATAVRGEFRMSFLNLGPTELRILLAIGAIAAYLSPRVTPFGLGPFLLFDIGGVVAVLGLGAAFVTSAVRNGAALYRDEPLRARLAKTGVMALALVAATAPTRADASTLGAETIRAWDAHVARVEAGLDRDRQSTSSPVGCGATEGSTASIPGGLIHEWRGCIFVPGITVEHLVTMLQHPSREWPRQPDVQALRVIERRPDHLKVFVRMTRTKLVTVTYNTEHDVVYLHEGRSRARSRSVATRIAEVEDAGAADEREKAPGNDRGFMWRLNSYWQYEDVNGGVRVHLLSLTLSRDVPRAFRFVLQPIIASIARESMERTLASIRNPPAATIGSRSEG